MPKVFISFSSLDRKLAASICNSLEARGHQCWMSTRDVAPGENYQGAIVRAIRGAGVMVLVFSANANNSEEIKKELALASQRKLMVIPVRAEDVVPSEDYTYELATRQWIDLFDDWEQAIDRLARQLDAVVPRPSAAVANGQAIHQKPSEPKRAEARPIPAAPTALQRSTSIIIEKWPYAAGGATALVLIAAAAAWVLSPASPKGMPNAQPQPQSIAATPSAPPNAATTKAPSSTQPQIKRAILAPMSKVPQLADAPTEPQTLNKTVPQLASLKTALAILPAAPKREPYMLSVGNLMPWGGLSSETEETVQLARSHEDIGTDQAEVAEMAQRRARQAAQHAEAAEQSAERGSKGYGVISVSIAGRGDAQWAGQVAGNQMTGAGVLTFSDGEKHWIEFDAPPKKESGLAAFVRPNGDRYEGEIKSGKKDGLGVECLAGGECFLGPFSSGRRQGYGILFGGKAAIIREARGGSFDGGVMTGDGVVAYKDGTMQVGQFKNSMLSGLGVRYDRLGQIIDQGKYERGKLISPTTKGN